MTYNWYQIFSLTEFVATGLTSKTYTFFLEGQGERDILVTSGNVVSVMYLDTFLPIQFNGENPYALSPYAVYLDTDDNVWIGVEQ